ncbi:MAG TPA: V-type ATPase subunit, partial [Kofleriaceae bacterium]|nr:V-type ATPase subunit [Kofleriaceae bacterium]
TELALARRYASCARLASNDHAVRAYVAQVIDVENAQAARLLAARGEELDRARAFLDGGERLDRATFLAAAAGPLDETDARLARAFAGTGALDSDDHDHALAWQLATQARLRRIDPHGPAAAIHVLLRRRAEARRIRRAAWRVALGGAP